MLRLDDNYKSFWMYEWDSYMFTILIIEFQKIGLF